MTYFFIILLFLHLLCCAITFLGIYTEILNVHEHMFFVVLFLPIWGFAIVLILHFQVMIKSDAVKDVSVEKMKLDSELYRGVTVDEKKNADAIIPLEEALAINSSRERRELIMDVLNDNPKEYIEFLQKAGNNDDTEVVHYAVTAMVEISKENDFMLQKYERLHAASPDDFKVLTEYADFLHSVLEQNLMQGQVEIMNRNTLSDLLRQKLEKEETLEDYLRYSKNNLKLKNYTTVMQALKKMNEKWPQNEDVILLELEYYSTLGRSDELKKLLASLEDNNVYLSAKAKEAIAFWKV